MTKLSLKNSLSELLNAGASLNELTKLVGRFKEEGGSQELAYLTLQELRTEIQDESKEDQVLEVMDFVSGFCLPGNRLW